MTCGVCGAENEVSAAFCYRCGSALKPAAATGETVSLGERTTPPFGTPAAAPAEESGARVYDVPAAAQRPAPNYAPPPVVPQPPAYSSPASSGVPSYNVPSYNVHAGHVDTPTHPSSNNAMIAMVLGIVSLVLFVVLLCTAFLMPISAAAAIPAIILGRNARKEIAASGGHLAGDGMARAGIIMGWINIALSVLSILAWCALFAVAAISSS